MEKKTINKKKLIIAITLLVVWMAVIFIMSAMSGEGSGRISTMIVRTITRIIPSLQGKEITHLVVRKLAHATEYAILCGLIINLEKALGYKIGIKQVLIAILGATLYAATDEYHQTFVSERSGNIKDVGIDFLGAIFTGPIVMAFKKKEE